MNIQFYWWDSTVERRVAIIGMNCIRCHRAQVSPERLCTHDCERIQRTCRIILFLGSSQLVVRLLLRASDISSIRGSRLNHASPPILDTNAQLDNKVVDFICALALKPRPYSDEFRVSTHPQLGMGHIELSNALYQSDSDTKSQA